MNSKIGLQVAGLFFEEVSAFNLSFSQNSLADGFNIVLPHSPKVQNIFKPFGYNPIAIFLDDELILTGVVLRLVISKENGQYAIEGLSLAGLLVDACHEGHYSWQKMSMLQIATELTAPYAITLRSDVDFKVMPHFTAEPTDKIADILNSLASQNGVFIISEPDGSLFITHRSEGSVVASFNNNSIGDMATFDATKRFNKVIFYGQSARQTTLKGLSVDDGVKAIRTLIASGNGSTIEELTLEATRKQQLQKQESIELTFSVPTFKTLDGKIWRKNMLVSYQNSDMGIDHATIFAIKELIFTFDASSYQTSFSLMSRLT